MFALLCLHVPQVNENTKYLIILYKAVRQKERGPTQRHYMVYTGKDGELDVRGIVSPLFTASRSYHHNKVLSST